jgi:hypothetical protein
MITNLILVMLVSGNLSTPNNPDGSLGGPEGSPICSYPLTSVTVVSKKKLTAAP